MRICIVYKKFIVLLLAFLPAVIMADEAAGEMGCLSVESADTIQTKKGSVISEWWNNLVNGNVDRTFERKMDLSFAVSPYYSAESSLGFGGQASALYRVNRKDSLMQPSDFTVMGGASINGTYSFGLQGNQHFTRNHRLNYMMVFQHQNRNFWGINYNECAANSPIINNSNRITVKADYQQRLFHSNWFGGAALRISYVTGNFDDYSYLLGLHESGFYAGLGALIQYDSRDYALNAKKGAYFLFREVYYPNKLGRNECDVYCTTLQFNAYHKLWPSAILAYDLFGEFNTSYGVVPWQLREEICTDDRRMRGYYTGRYIDNNQICAQIELRQNIYKRFGAVIWGGYGTMFYNLTEIHHDQILPTYGIGVRFEMKHNTNLRVDIGGGRNSGTVIFNFAEAF